jgi:glucose-6-phosphate dehydrogenase assembly protein OpcA
VRLDVAPVVTALSQARRAEGSTTATTMTFVLFFEDPSVSTWVRERTRAVAEKHPSRVIVFDGTAPAGEQHAEPPAKRGEWVDIGVAQSEPHELASALSMLALPEAPIVLAWIARSVVNDDRFLALAKVSTTVIVSSSVIASRGEALHDLMALVERHPEIPIQDIAYLRLGPWQELIAEFFDESELLTELTSLRSVEITAGSDSEMYYLLGWLASRLGWAPCARNQLCNRVGQIITFAMNHDGPARRLSSVVLASERTTFTARVFSNDDCAVSLEVTGAHTRSARCTPLHTLDIASLVERAILTQTRDEAFIESLAMAKHIMERQAS